MELEQQGTHSTQSTSTGANNSGYADILDFKLDSLKPLPERDHIVYDDVQGYRNLSVSITFPYQFF